MDDLVKKIAIIPARGGSKRLPHKNILDFMGKPMIIWTLEAALESKLFDKIIVSTDSNEIKDVVQSFGIEVPFLRSKTADDFSPVSLATIEALEQSESYFNERFDHVIQLMANCPIRNTKNIIDQYNFFLNNTNRSSVISSFSYGMFNPFWAHQINNDGTCIKLFGEKFKDVRSQDLPSLLCPSGATWISTREKLITENTYYSKEYKLFEIPWQKAVDIDDENDLNFAKIVYNYEKI